MRNSETLETIADKLLNGEIDSETAKLLCEKIPINNSKQQNSLEYTTEVGSSQILAYDNNDQEIGRLEYLFNERIQGPMFIDYVESYQQNKGIFHATFNELLKYTKEKNITQILLEVDKRNENAIKIYEHYGFHQTDDLSFTPSKVSGTEWMIFNLNFKTKAS